MKTQKTKQWIDKLIETKQLDKTEWIYVLEHAGECLSYIFERAVEILADIFTVAKVLYSIDDIFADAVVTGYIPYTTCRDALMHVAFAIQAVVDTSNSEVVKVFALDEDVKQTVPLNRIMQGQNFADEETVTGIDVTVHTYIPLPESERDYLYKAEDSGTGENILVIFPGPQHNVQISSGEILRLGTNYAVINANAGCQLWGQGYEHKITVRRKSNPVVLASEIEKIVAIDNATLVSVNNIDNVLDKCYNWLVKTNTTNLKIVEGKHVQYGDYIKYGEKKYGTFKYGDKTPNIVTYDEPVNIGENIQAETEYLGVVSGRLIKQSFNLNGNIIIKEAVLK